MSNLLYFVAAVLLILWSFGFFFYQFPDIIHILLVLAIIAILMKVIRGNNVFN
jgi:hypothetical protein